MTCPCGTGTKYTDCCQPYHDGKNPENALLLMRSRYSAYAKGLADYIMLTTHPFAISLDRQQWRKTIEQFCLHTHFVKLEILEFMENPQTATVTFVATLLQGSKDVSFKEKSLFEMVHHRWLYLSGEVEPLSSPKNSV